MTLSVCIIVKNEEARIRDFLMSVKDFADEVVIVDTGSLDKTIDVVKEVSQREEINVVIDEYIRLETFHFGKAKNHALKKAKMDYMLILDIDERPSIEFKKGIKDFLEKEKPFIATIKLIDELLPRHINYPLRIIKNHQNILHAEEERDSIHHRIIHNYQVKGFLAPVFHCQRESGAMYSPQRILPRVILKVNEEERNNRPFVIYFLRAVRNFWRKFYKIYFKKQLYKDGKTGFKYAFLRSFYLFLVVIFVGLKPKKNYKYWEDPKWQPPKGLV